MLQEIQSSVSAIQDMSSQIATAAEEQSHVAAEINTNIVSVNDISISTFENSNNSLKLAKKLTDVADTLNRSVSRFRL